MKPRYGELQIGITVLIAIVVLVVGVLWFQGFTTSSDTYNLVVYFPQASGLDKGDPVEVAGVVSGKVDAIEYEKGRAKLTLAIDKKAEIYRDARVRLANFGMMGQKFVAVEPGTPSLGALNVDQPIEGEYEASIAEMMSGAGRTVAVMESLAVQVSAFIAAMDSSGGGAAFGRTLTNMERATGDIAELTSDTKSDLRRAISNFDAGTRELKELMTDKGPTLRSTIDNFESTSARLDSIGAELAVLSREAQELLGQARSTDGNVGALLEDRELYDRLLRTVARTDSLLRDVQRNPRRYFKFSVF